MQIIKCENCNENVHLNMLYNGLVRYEIEGICYVDIFPFCPKCNKPIIPAIVRCYMYNYEEMNI